MTDRSLLTVTLAAGLGTRMKSSKPKVMHPLAGRPLVEHVLAGAQKCGAVAHAVVIGPDMDVLRDLVQSGPYEADLFVQRERLGTAHAVLAARAALEDWSGDVLVLYGDTPLITPETLNRLIHALGSGADIAVLGFHADNPTGYGRLLVTPEGKLLAIREEKDASADERAVTFCNSGVFAFRGEYMLGILDRIGNDNAKGEYYLTDAVEIGRGDGREIVAIECSEDEVLGINSRNQLAVAEAVAQSRLREKAMTEGVTLLAPETVYFSYDTEIGRDVVIEPHVVFGTGVRIDDGVTVKAFCHLEQAHVGAGAVIGPYARLRPDADIGPKARIGNFVEVKKSMVEEGAKVNHLSYIGDARIGAGANIGAGTITCNYDGYFKNTTDIGAGAFIGSNSALVAPVKIGDGAYVGSGSVINKNVDANALALTRAPQQQRDGWAEKYRSMQERRKSRLKGG